MGYSFRLATMVLLYASSHRQDNTYHGLCYTSRGALAGTRNSSIGTSTTTYYYPYYYYSTTTTITTINNKSSSNSSSSSFFFNELVFIFTSKNSALICQSLNSPLFFYDFVLLFITFVNN